MTMWRRLRTMLARSRSMPSRVERLDHGIAVAIPDHLDALATHVTGSVRNQGDVHRGETAQAFTDLAAAAAERHDALLAQLAQSTTTLSAEIRDARATLDATLAEVAVLQHQQHHQLQQLLAEAASAQHRLAHLADEATRATQQRTALADQLADQLARAIHGDRITLEAVLADTRDRVAAELVATHAYPLARVDGLTVIMTTWNHGAWLRSAIESAQATLAALTDEFATEILIIDDGSTDESGAVLAAFDSDPQVRVLRSPANIAIGRARNVLLAACRTRHAVILDADNWLLPHGVVDIHAVAHQHGSTITFGHVIAATDDDRTWTTFSNPPTIDTILNGQAFDSMCIIDVASVQALGGYSVDPNLAGVADDFELFNRALRRSHLVAFVPTVIGRYRLTATRHSAGSAHMPSVERRIQRSYHYDRPDLERMRVVIAHPRTGVVWATRAADDLLTSAPALQPPAEAIAPARAKRILLIASGGVGNLGDDAIGEVVLQRIRSADPGVRIDVVTDRHALNTRGRPAPWVGTVADLWQALSDKELEFVVERAGANASWLIPAERRNAVVDLAGYDAVHIAGGGNLADAFADDQARPRLALAFALHGLGVPVTWSGQGIGPCSAPLIELLSAVAGCAVAFGCRDPESADLLAAAAPSDAHVACTADDALLHPQLPDEQFRLALRSLGLRTGPFITVHVRSAIYTSEVDTARWAHAVDQLARRRGAAVIVLAIDDNAVPELELAARLAADLDTSVTRRAQWRFVDATQDARLARAFLANAEAVVSCSFHLALWSLHSGTPAVLLESSEYYAAKARALSRLAGVDTVGVPAANLDGEMLDRALGAVQSALRSDAFTDAATVADSWWSQRQMDWSTHDARAAIS